MDTDLFSDASSSGSSSDVFDLSSIADGSPLDETSPEAPYGYTVDPQTGDRRPKKRAGRPRTKSTPPPAAPTIDALRKHKAKAGDTESTEDTAPKVGKAKTSLFGKPKAEYAEPEPLPPFRAGPIAKGMNGIYRKAGKLAKMWDRNVGETIIMATHKEDEDDLTVGEAWENLAKANPRIRAFLLKLIQGDAYGGLLMAHLPILIAVAIRLKQGEGEKSGLGEVAMDFMADYDPRTGQSEPTDVSQAMGGMGPEDMAQMMAMAQGMMGQFMPQTRNQNPARVPVEEVGE